jgi:hypothetical protein
VPVHHQPVTYSGDTRCLGCLRPSKSTQQGMRTQRTTYNTTSQLNRALSLLPVPAGCCSHSAHWNLHEAHPLHEGGLAYGSCTPQPAQRTDTLDIMHAGRTCKDCRSEHACQHMVTSMEFFLLHCMAAQHYNPRTDE